MRTIYYKRTSFYLIIVILTMSVFVLKTINDIDNLYTKKRGTTTERPFVATSAKQYKKHVTKSLAELGKMDEISSYILFFNKIPHSGSELLSFLIQKLQGWNNFKHIKLRDDIKRKLSTLEEEELVYEVDNVIKNEPVPLCFDRHVHFINFTRFGKQSPTFFNLIRDPIDNIVSRFNLFSSKNYRYKHLDFEACIRNSDARCIFTSGQPYDLTISYFCGQDERCMYLDNRWALQKAKTNVEHYYSTVGTFEEVNATLEVIEFQLPYFFKGVQNHYFKVMQGSKKKFNEKYKISKFVKNYLKEKLKMEYEFYNWIKGRLFKQLQILYGEHHHSQ